MKNPRQFDFKENAAWRMFRIMSEFTEGFEFIATLKKAVTIFGSAVLPEGNRWYQEAEKLGSLLASHDFDVITGGGPGIMEAANRGAVKFPGGDSVGLNIKLPKEQRTNPYVERSMAFHYFFTRKVCMSFSAHAYVYFPGGFGTLDELFEIVTLVQTDKIPPVPIILVGKDFWQPLMRFIEETLLMQYETIDARDRKLITLVNTAEEAFKIIDHVVDEDLYMLHESGGSVQNKKSNIKNKKSRKKTKKRLQKPKPKKKVKSSRKVKKAIKKKKR